MRTILHILARLAMNGIAVYAASEFLHGVGVDSFKTALLVAIALGILNTFIRPILDILTLPINILTLGLFHAVISGVIIMVVPYFVPGFFVASFFWALMFGLFLSLINSFFSVLAE